MTDDKLSDADEVLFRQIHPSFMEDGEPSSQPFMPTPKDQNQLSVDRGSITTAKASHDLFLSAGLISAAVYGVTVGEFEEHAIACAADPIVATEEVSANPAHAYADYSPHATNKQKTLAKRIKQRALARGQLHPVSSKSGTSGSDELGPSTNETG